MKTKERQPCAAGIGLTVLGILLCLYTTHDVLNFAEISQWLRDLQTADIIRILAGVILLPSVFIFHRESPVLLIIERSITGLIHYLPAPIAKFLNPTSSTSSLRLTWQPFVFGMAGITPLFILLLHISGIFPISWQYIPLTDKVEPGTGFAFTLPLDGNGFELLGSLGTEAGVVYEDGNRLLAADAHNSVQRLGGGNYYIAPNKLFFSTSDNTDPRTNGRSYTYARPTPIGPYRIIPALLLALVTVSIILTKYRAQLGGLLMRPPLYLPAFIFMVPFIIYRLWFFIDFPVAGIHPDSGSYFALSEQIGSGAWPQFYMRPPVYPLFMKASFLISDRVISVIILQTIISLLSGLLMVIAIHHLRSSLSVWGALAMAGYYCSTSTLEHDTSLLSESLYTSLNLLSYALLILGLSNRNQSLFLWLSSTCMALSIMTRPQGYFFLVVYLVVLLYLLWNKYERKIWISFAAPFPALLIILSIYNALTLQALTPSTWGEANLAVATFTFWESDPEYPPEINETIGRIQSIIDERLRIAGTSRDILYTSWNYPSLAGVFELGFNGAALEEAMNMGSDVYRSDNRKWIRKIAFDSISKHPDVYFKFVYTMLALYYNGIGPASDFDFRLYLLNRAGLIYLQKYFSSSQYLIQLGKEYAGGNPPANIHLLVPDPVSGINLSEQIIVSKTPAWRLYSLIQLVREKYFANILWSIILICVLIISSIILIRTKARSLYPFILFVLTIGAFGASLIVSLVELSQPRYSYPMEWVYYISLVLSPLLASSPKAN